MTAIVFTLLVAGASICGVIVRPWRWPEAVWAVAGAAMMVATGLLPWPPAIAAVGKGLDVYLFLAGMMLLSELARREGVFDWLAAHAAMAARKSAARLFLMVYAVGVIVTLFMSNDATAVVLTPAVFAAARAAGAKPLPYLFACALVANAASFGLPISNPANLVVFHSQPPALPEWIARFGLASLAAIVSTYCTLRVAFSKELSTPLVSEISPPSLALPGRLAAAGTGGTAIALTGASLFHLQLGWPTFACGIVTGLVILILKREGPAPLLRGISWQILPLVAGLFVIVEALAHAGVIEWLSASLRHEVARNETGGGFAASLIVALGGNLINNLPAGLISAMTLAASGSSEFVRSAVLIGIDLGPNLSVTGSLATILWLAALRREGENVTAWQFLKLGMIAMPAGLVPALAVLWLEG